MKDLTLESRLVRNPDLLAVPMDGDLVMMSVERGEYFGLSGVAMRCWELFERPLSLCEAAQTICAEFDVDEDTCHADILIFAQELVSCELVTMV